LALRGQINDTNWDKNLKEAQDCLDKCKQLAPDRAETYYNEAILTQEYKSKSTGGNEKATIPVLKAAIAIYDTFVQKAGGAPEYADAVKRAGERKDDLQKTIKFLEEGVKADEEAAQAAANAPAAPAGLDESAGEAPAGSGAAPAPDAPKK
jgi:hypothetical protein